MPGIQFYWQYLSGMRYFQHEVPLDPSGISRWRGRADQAGAGELLAQTIRAGLELKAVKPSQLKRVNVATTVQEKNVRFPTDSRLYDRARERLVKAVRAEGIELRQSYARVGKILLKQQSRYAQVKQFKRARRCQRKLRTILGQNNMPNNMPGIQFGSQNHKRQTKGLWPLLRKKLRSQVK